MALSAKLAPTEALVMVCNLAIAMGGRVTEMLPWDPPNKGAHAQKSWHYDVDRAFIPGKVYGQAADINFGPPGINKEERAKVLTLIRVCESAGVSYIYARDGIVGSAKQHQDHLHIDVGSYTNSGTGLRKTKAGSIVAYRTQKALHFTGTGLDNLFGANSRQRLDAVRATSNRHGVKFPYGVHVAQAAVGTTTDGIWGAKSRAAHDATVKALQTEWRAAGMYTGAIDGIWGPLMDTACQKFLTKYGR